MFHLDDEMKKRMLPGYEEIPFLAITTDVELGERVSLSPYINLWGCIIGDDTSIGAYTEIGKGVIIGRRCKIAAKCFIPPGVSIADDCFVGPGVIFTNDKHPRASGEWKMEYTRVEHNVSIGAGCIILPGISIGAHSLIGAGSRVLKDVPSGIQLHDLVGSHVSTPDLLTKAERGT